MALPTLILIFSTVTTSKLINDLLFSLILKIFDSSAKGCQNSSIFIIELENLSDVQGITAGSKDDQSTVEY